MKGPSFLLDRDNLARQAVVTATNPADETNYPIVNAVTLPVAKTARILNRSENKIHLSFPGAVSIDFAALVAHNLSGDATITLRGGSTFDGSTFTQAVTPSRRTSFAILEAAQSFQYWSFSLTDPANEYGFIEVGYIALGVLANTGIGIDFDWQYSDLMHGVRSSSETGTPLHRHLAERQRVEMRFRQVASSDVPSIRNAFLDSLGPTEPAFMVPVSSVNEGFFGRFEMDEFSRRFQPLNRVNTGMTFIEDPPGRTVVEQMPMTVTGRSLPSGTTFVRSSVAWYKDSNLALREAAVNTIRGDFPGSEALNTGRSHYLDHGKSGFLLEPSRINRIIHSEDLTQSVYIKENVTISADFTNEPKASPVGNADKVVEASDTDQLHRVRHQLSGLTDNTLQAASVFVKEGERSWCWIASRDKGNTRRVSWFRLSTGLFGTVDPGHVVFAEKYADGWYRLMWQFNSASGGTTPDIEVGITTANNIQTYNGDGSSGLFLWGFDFERDSPWPTSYKPTGGSEFTRSIDRLQVPWVFAPQSMTAYFDMWTLPGSHQIATARVFQIPGSSNLTPRVLIFLSGTTWAFQHSRGGPDMVEVNRDVAGIGARQELRGELHPSGAVRLGSSVDGGAESLSGLSAVLPFHTSWAAQDLRIGQREDSVASTGLYKCAGFVRGVQSLDRMRKLVTA